MKTLGFWWRRLMVHRRVLAAVAAGVCVLLVTSAIRGTSEASVQVCTASERIAAGVTVEAGMLTLTSVPAALVPEGAVTDPAAAAGRMTAAPVPAGAILTTAALVDASQADPGHVIIPLTVSAQLLGLIHPGDHVSVFVTSSAGAVTVTRGVRVVTVPAAVSGGFMSSSTSNTILVEVEESVASALASGTAVSQTTVALE